MFAIDVDNIRLNAGPQWQSSSVLRLAHSSVVEFLEQAETLSDHARKFTITNSEGHLLIAQSCLAYILHLDSSTAPPVAADDCPLFDYAIHYWYYHAQRAGIHDDNLASLIEKVLQTRWEIYRLVTYSNMSTRYNPWGGTHVSTSEPGEDTEQENILCTACRSILLEDLQKDRGMVHKTYAALVASAHECSLCKMIHCALLQFGIARYCQFSSETALSLKALESISRELDAEINRIAGISAITLRMETHDPFLLISCYCYFGRLHLHANTGAFPSSKRSHLKLLSSITDSIMQESPLASSIFGRPFHSHPGSALAESQRWLQACEDNHTRCHNYAPTRSLPSRLIEIGEERIRLLHDTQGVTGKFATLTWVWGSAMAYHLRVENLSKMIQAIRFGDLPRLLQDVIRVTQGLGIRYLWIDALCIIQDDEKDWVDQTRKVPDYFATADLNIVAGVKDCDTEILYRRLPPRFQPIRLGGTEDVSIGWLGTDAYNDPRGLRVSQYPDAWKYKSPPNLRGWTMSEMELARRNLVIQGDEASAQDSETMCKMLTSQLYMQCQEEVRWENGRRRPGTTENSADWYDLVEEFSGRNLTWLSDKLPAFSPLAHRYSHASQHHCGEFIAGLWSNDLFRGLLWRAEEDREYWPTDPQYYVVPSWSWAACPGRVKHVWPLDATPLASIQKLPVNPKLRYQNRGSADGSLILRGLLVGIKPVGRTWGAWNGGIEVDILDESEHKGNLMIRYTLDNFNPEATREARLYGIRITCRIGLLLVDSGQGNGTMERVGLFIVAKPDTLKWTTLTGERDVTII